MSNLARTASVRGILALLVRVLRSPAVRRRLLPLLHPGRTVADSGRVYREQWKVPAPVLGDECVPGCDDPMVDWDGVHYCKVDIGAVRFEPRPELKGMAHGFVVQVAQTQGEGRHVWLIGLNHAGGYADDGMRLPAAAVAQLGELLDTALVVAGHAPAGRAAHRTAGGAW